MTISDQSRHRLHQRLDEVLGVDDAATLMEHLPPVGWADVVTKRDLDHLAAGTKGDLDRFAAEIRGELRTGLAEVRAELATGFGAQQVELHKEIGALRGDMARQTPTLLVGLVGLQLSAAGVAVALSRLL